MNGGKVYPKILDALTGSPHYTAFQKSFWLTWERRHLACKKFCKTQCRLEACAPRGRMLKARHQSVTIFENWYNVLYMLSTKTCATATDPIELSHQISEHLNGRQQISEPLTENCPVHAGNACYGLLSLSRD